MLRKSVGQLSKAAGRRAFTTSEAAGVKIASVDDGRPVSEVSLIVNAGPRFNPVPGAAHVLEKFAFRDTAAKSALRLTRESELLGGLFFTKLDREKLVLTTKFLREDLPYFVEALANVAKGTLYKPYEYNEIVKPQVAAEVAKFGKSSKAVALDAAHEAAFRTGLGNPLSASLVTPVSLETTKAFGESAYNKGNFQLVARGVSQGDIDSFVAREFDDVASGQALTSGKTQFFGGERRIPSANAEQVVTLAFPVEYEAALDVLPNTLIGQHVKWSSGSGLLHEIGAKSGVSVSSDVHRYSDASLFTITLAGASANGVAAAAAEVATALKQIASNGPGAEATKAGIAATKFAQADAISNLSFHYTELATDVSQVTEASLKSAAEKLLKSKVTLAAVGQVHLLPYLDELF